MPKIEISLKDLENLIGKKLSLEELEAYLSYAKCEIEERDNDLVKVETKDSNRPDLWSVEGIARILKGILDIETGIPKYTITNSGQKVYVDDNIKYVRPFIACAIVKNVNLREEGYSSLIQLQDKVMHTYGRKRKKVAIGTSNLDLIEFPVYYKTVKPGEIKFIPLYEEREMNLREILEQTEKGREYGWILKDYSRYPILVDSKNEVISFPPIINSNTIGRITPETKNIFVDVTGTDWESILVSLNVIVTALTDRGGKIESVEIVYPDKTMKTPIFEKRSIEIEPGKIKKLVGIDLDDQKIVSLLKKMRYDVELVNNKIKVWYLNYRNDIFSWRDVFEDIVIAYGYNNFPSKKLEISTIGNLNDITKFVRVMRDIMISLGLIELHTPVLMSSSYLKLFNLSGIELENPVSENYNVIRPYIFPNIIESFVYNKREELPQEVFEVGLTARLKNDTVKESYNLSFGIMNKRISVTEIKEVLESIFINLGVKYNVEPKDYEFLIPGRSGNILLNNVNVGFFGEVYPEILEKLDLCNPVTICEINLNKLLRHMKL